MNGNSTIEPDSGVDLLSRWCLNLFSDAVMKWRYPHDSMIRLSFKFHKHTNKARTALQ